MSVKNFMSRYYYSSIQMFVRQVAIAIFGLVIALATEGTFQIVTSVFAIIFYLFLIYDIAYSVGSKDGVSKTVEPPMLSGLYISLLANIPNILCAVLGFIGWLTSFSTSAAAETVTQIGGVAQVIALFLQGMFTGSLTLQIAPEQPLNSFWWTYFVIVLFPLAVSTFAYIFGRKGIGASSIFVPRNAEEEEIRREKKNKNND